MIHLLAASDDSPIKVFAGIVFVIIWIIGSLTSAAAKKREEERRRRINQTLETDRALPPQLPIPQRVQLPPQPLPPVMLRRIEIPPGQQQRPIRKQQKSRRKPAPPPIKFPLPTVPIAAPAPFQAVKAAIDQPVVPIKPSATASSLHSWLRPATLRQQFILTEVFQPPVSLR